MINDNYAGNSKSSLACSKPYSKPCSKSSYSWKMDVEYFPPMLQQFDRRDNPKQNIAHFVETCNNASTNGDLLV